MKVNSKKLKSYACIITYLAEKYENKSTNFREVQLMKSGLLYLSKVAKRQMYMYGLYNRAART